MDEKLKEFVMNDDRKFCVCDCGGCLSCENPEGTKPYLDFAQAVAAFTEKRVLEELSRDFESISSFTPRTYFETGEKRGMETLKRLVDQRLAALGEKR